jgi:hypothetical protein
LEFGQQVQPFTFLLTVMVSPLTRNQNSFPSATSKKNLSGQIQFHPAFHSIRSFPISIHHYIHTAKVPTTDPLFIFPFFNNFFHCSLQLLSCVLAPLIVFLASYPLLRVWY